MLTHSRIPVCLSFISTDLSICSEVDTLATLYQKDQERFHLLLTEPQLCDRSVSDELGADPTTPPSRLLWLELSPYRVTMTMQGNGQFSYRHFWERGVYGLSRYWLHASTLNTISNNGQIRLRNFTRDLMLRGSPLPNYLRVDYELWSENLQLGHYVLSVEISY